jgi:hypothetical protein
LIFPLIPRPLYNPGMKKDQSKPDANQTAARVVQESTARHSDALPADLEAAWKAWSSGVGKVDARAMALLKAAFEAGAEAAKMASKSP